MKRFLLSIAIGMALSACAEPLPPRRATQAEVNAGANVPAYISPNLITNVQVTAIDTNAIAKLNGSGTNTYLRNYILTNGILNSVGNTRGTNTTDFQNIRNNTNQYAWARNSTIGGGLYNRIDIEEPASVISGGEGNAITNGVSGAGWDSIGGGRYNVVDASEYSSIPGGQSNNILGSTGSAIGGGRFNYNNGIDNTLGGGNKNYIQGENHYIGGGKSNMISGESSFASIVGGFRNIIGPDGGVGSFILGGENNQVNADLAGAIGNNITNNDFETIKIGTGTTAMSINNTGLVTAVAFAGNGAGITGIVAQTLTNFYTFGHAIAISSNLLVDNQYYVVMDSTNDHVFGDIEAIGTSNGTNLFDVMLRIDGRTHDHLAPDMCQFQGTVSGPGDDRIAPITFYMGIDPTTSRFQLTFTRDVGSSVLNGIPYNLTLIKNGTNLPALSLTETNMGSFLTTVGPFTPGDRKVAANSVAGMKIGLFDANGDTATLLSLEGGTIGDGVKIGSDTAHVSFVGADLGLSGSLSVSGGANIDGGLCTFGIVTYDSSSGGVAATGWTNILGRNAQVFITAATFAAITNQYGIRIMAPTPVTSPLAFTMQTNWTLVGTGIVGTAQAW